jgi:uncharacterized protein (DUF697 family)
MPSAADTRFPGTGLRRKLASALGGSLALKQVSALGLRELLKVVPGVGSAAGAAMGAAITYALGQAACVLLHHQKMGQQAPDSEIRRAFREAFREKFTQSS